MGSYVAVAGAWAVELEPEPPLFSRLWLRPKRAAPAPAPQHCPPLPEINLNEQEHENNTISSS